MASELKRKFNSGVILNRITTYCFKPSASKIIVACVTYNDDLCKQD